MKSANRLKNVEEYYFSKRLKEVDLLISQGKPIINMGVGSPDLSPPENVIEEMNKACLDYRAHQYQSYQGIIELREAFVNFYKTHYNVQINPQNEVLPLIGSKEGIFHISMAFLNQGDEVLIPNPGYPTYTSVTSLVGAIPKYYNLSESTKWLPNLNDLEKSDLSKIKIMWLNYPHMPTGSNISFDDYKNLVNFAKKHNILLVNDNPYSFILNDNPLSILSIDDAMDVCLELNSLSKTFNMSGWRIGMVLGNQAHIQNIIRVKSNMDSGMFFGLQKGAIKALNAPKSWFEKINTIYETRRNLVFELAQKIHCTFDEDASGMFVWAKLPKENPSEKEVVDSLLYEKNIFITPGSIFGSQGKGYVRFSLCIEENKIKDAIKRF